MFDGLFECVAGARRIELSDEHRHEELGDDFGVVLIFMDAVLVASAR